MKISSLRRIGRGLEVFGFAVLWAFATFCAAIWARGDEGLDREALRTAQYVKLAAPADDPGESWEQGSAGVAPAHRTSHTAVWTGSEMIVWGGAFYDGTNLNYFADGARYNPAVNSWTAVNNDGAPTKRDFHTAVWTGREMIVWGGFNGTDTLSDGWRYDPAADQWTPVSSNGAPAPRTDHSAVWTGSEMIVWGGSGPDGDLGDGGRYDPTTDSWQPVSMTGAPGARCDHSAVWTGSEMVIWGGFYYLDGAFFLGDGARYNPSTDTWAAVSNQGAPNRRRYQSAVWTGAEMIVFGGYYNDPADDHDHYDTDAGRYNPTTDTWSPVSMMNAPWPRTYASAAWTGSKMIIWGGSTEFGQGDDGGVYDPASDTWTPTSTTGAPSARANATAVWTGSEMIVWGGYSLANSVNTYFNDGGRYNPDSDSWRLVGAGAPVARYLHTAVWTGSEMIVWGGFYYADTFSYFWNDGSRYNPVTDSWTPISSVSAPSARDQHTAVWTGSQMIVWGGFFQDSIGHYLSDGGKYDPISDAWTPLSAVGAPTGRVGHAAIWTGHDMIVWGGFSYDTASHFYNDGAGYDPALDQWTPLPTSGAPAGRDLGAVVWSGTEMLVWGGTGDNGDLTDGGRYNPMSGWSAMNTAGAPAARHTQSAIWSGKEMLVWGGAASLQYFNDGGRYDPAADQWKPITTNGAPSPRYSHSAVWTGTEMIIWGGDFFDNNDNYLATGARYNPTSGVWAAMTTNSAPPGRYYHTAVWTGTEMLVWGGYGGDGYYNDTWVYRASRPKTRVASSNDSSMVVAWPYPSSGFQLEQGASPAGSTWNPVSAAVQVGSEWQFTAPMTNGAAFFRLRKP